ncbi:deoxyribose-phosphate aldolase [Aliidiomarina iranensis]|uniref:Deoxyribose-phosphate aldolase n=1 Tax=Aliidiomarina iranensis TaxID=1434071 RepID=A0A432W262_9GAMM|nr:deoxyribose-phosphate aldolase [Aliidiomarina iranensis]RUO23320.1 deoxyribose-phosphate aldolase [Aliidiomarina iranensis]
MNDAQLAAADAAKAFALLDLTSLTDQETEADIAALVANASWQDTSANPQITERLQVAALCIFPRFLPLARKLLDERDLYSVRLATVTNFPHGNADIDIAVKETRAAVAYGADEVDVVLPYRALLAGDTTTPLQLVQACKAECGSQTRLKVILETGELKTPELITKAAEIAIAGGADFIKTSTGKVAENATPEKAKIMLQVIANYIQEQKANKSAAHATHMIGFKPAGGIRNLSDALVYMQAAEEILGADAVHPRCFRLGVSSVRANLVATLEGGQEHTASGGY